MKEHPLAYANRLWDRYQRRYGQHPATSKPFDWREYRELMTKAFGPPSGRTQRLVYGLT